MAVSRDPSRSLQGLVRIFLWLPFVAVAVLLGIALSWKIPAAIGLFYVLLLMPLKIDRARQARPHRWLQHDKTLTGLMVVVGGVFGAAIFGFLGFIVGATAAFGIGMSAFMTLSLKNEKGEMAPYDASNAFQTARLWKIFGLFLLIGPIVVAVLFFLAWLTGH